MITPDGRFSTGLRETRRGKPLVHRQLDIAPQCNVHLCIDSIGRTKRTCLYSTCLCWHFCSFMYWQHCSHCICLLWHQCALFLSVSTSQSALYLSVLTSAYWQQYQRQHISHQTIHPDILRHNLTRIQLHLKFQNLKKCRIIKLAFIPFGSFIWQNFRISPVTLDWRWNCVSCHRRSVCFVKSRRTPATRGPMTADCPNIHHLPDPLTPTPIFQPLLQTPNFLALHPLFSQFDRSQYTKLTSVPLPLSYKASLIWIYRLAAITLVFTQIYMGYKHVWIYPWVLAREWL